MRTIVVLAVLVGLGPAGGSAAEGERPQAVMEYLGNRASRQAAALPALPKDLPAWQKRRAEVRAGLSEVLGLPPRQPMRAKVLAAAVDDDLVVEDVMYLWHERAYVSGNVVRPRQAGGRLPAIVVPPGWLGELKQAYYKPFVYHMARKGYVMLFFDDPHVGKRAAPYAGLYGLASAGGTQVMGVQVFDTLRGLDYLLTRPDVDPGRIGICGLCQGSEQTYLAAALEDRFRVVSPVCGTTTYEGWTRMPFFLKVGLSDPSPYVEGVLRRTDWHEIDACIAPRPVLIASNSGDNWWPKDGFDKVVSTLKQAFATHGAGDRFAVVFDLRSHDMTPFIPQIDPWFEKHLRPLPPGEAAPQPCQEPLDGDFSMVRYFQRRIAAQSADRPAAITSAQAWLAYRKDIVAWLARACSTEELRIAPARTTSSQTVQGLTVQAIELPQDDGLWCPATVLSSAGQFDLPRPAVILSYGDNQCIADAAVDRAARQLAAAGNVVIVPEHASFGRASRRQVSSPGANFISFYGCGDAVSLPPLAMRVWDDLSCARYLAGRKDVDPSRIVIVGSGIGGLDAALAACLDERIAGVAALGAITVRDWADRLAPTQHAFDRILPYLPWITTKTDLDVFYAAVAPRPLVLVETDGGVGWPREGFDRVATTCRRVFGALSQPKALVRLDAKECTDARARQMDGPVQKLLVSAAAAMLPAPAANK